MTSAIASQLKSVLDSPDIIPWEIVETAWKDKIKKTVNNSCTPHYLITPTNIETLQDTIKIASENKWSMLPCGNGTKLHWGGLVSDTNLVISTQKLNHVIDHAVSDLTITVEAGIKLSDLQAILRHHNQFLPIDPTYPKDATIGGIMATADTGSWRQRYGGIRDLVLGLSFVRWDGEVAKAGGKVVKNVAGYDLMKLFTGSYGTLGIISTVTFRLYPIPEASGTLVMTGEADDINQMAKTLLQSGLQPTSAEIVSSSVVKTLELGEKMGLMVRFQSIPKSIKEQSKQVQAIAEKLDIKTTFCQDQIELNLWQRLQELIRVSSTNSTITGKMGIIPNQAISWLIKLNDLTPEKAWAMINLSSGIGQFKLEMEPSLGILKQLRSLAQENRGFLTILEANQSIKKQFDPWGYSGNALPLMKQIKKQFDPHNLFSPSRFI
ncbi:FAD-binding oxidoreductase [Crocosphaera chwakensis]|uniref:Glycolate oxidase subunit n=1 Tax=Crocosphaera chwakensis CCY0110 TaxID=391612 RepID=A3IN88_9CHRO|nr:FAD-binding oxidoreductase [Crocosphaera chwakensis]EAZ92065.1 glycolate oxidase subunit [Crocosphaera chwakensis CCY0110]